MRIPRISKFGGQWVVTLSIDEALNHAAIRFAWRLNNAEFARKEQA